MIVCDDDEPCQHRDDEKNCNSMAVWMVKKHCRSFKPPDAPEEIDEFDPADEGTPFFACSHNGMKTCDDDGRPYQDGEDFFYG